MHWKVFLALLGVVIVGATLGSVLGPNSPTPDRGTLAYRILLDSPQSWGGIERLLELFRLAAPRGNSTQVGGWTGYVPHPTKAQRRRICRELRKEAPTLPLPGFCTTHH